MPHRVLLFLTILSLHVHARAQETKRQFIADSVFIYKSTKHAGTTASLKQHHRYLDSLHAPKGKLREEELAECIAIFKTTPSKKLFQQKYGGELYYMLVYHKGVKKRFILYTSLDAGRLDDLDTMKCWILKNTEDKRRLYELIKKNEL